MLFVYHRTNKAVTKPRRDYLQRERVVFCRVWMEFNVSTHDTRGAVVSPGNDAYRTNNVHVMITSPCDIMTCTGKHITLVPVYVLVYDNYDTSSLPKQRKRNGARDITTHGLTTCLKLYTKYCTWRTSIISLIFSHHTTLSHTHALPTIITRHQNHHPTSTHHHLSRYIFNCSVSRLTTVATRIHYLLLGCSSFEKYCC